MCAKYQNHVRDVLNRRSKIGCILQIRLSCRIATALQGCSSQTGDMVVATERLKQELESSLRRQELVNNFLQSYQLTPDEVRASCMEEPRQFATARICQVLLGSVDRSCGVHDVVQAELFECKSI
jgi:hypothetical protein